MTHADKARVAEGLKKRGVEFVGLPMANRRSTQIRPETTRWRPSWLRDRCFGNEEGKVGSEPDADLEMIRATGRSELPWFAYWRVPTGGAGRTIRPGAEKGSRSMSCDIP